MSLQLLIYFSAQGPSQWLLLGEDHNIQSGPHSTFADECVKLAANATVIALVPTEQVMLLQTTLATRNRKRLQSAIPYALEEQLADGLESLHFAFIQDHNQMLQHVAVVAKHQMQTWLQQLSDCGITPDALYPNVFCLQQQATAWQVLLTEHRAIVQTGRYQGFAVPTNQLQEFLELALTQASVQAPTHIEIHNGSGEPYEILNAAHSLVGVPVHIDVISDPVLVMLAKNFKQNLELNLLQGDYQLKPPHTGNHKIWRRVGSVALLWLIIVVVSNLTQCTVLNWHQQSQANSIKHLYQSIFPQATAIVSPGVRIQQTLDQLQQSRGGNSLLMLLKLSSPILKKSAGITLSKMNFQTNILTLELTAASFQQLETLTTQLKQTGLRVRQRQASTHDKIITAEIELQQGAS